MNWDLPDEQARFRKGQITRDQTVNIHWNSRKIPTSASLTTLKPLTVWITANCGNFLKSWEYQTTLHVPWENEGQEATVRIGHETKDWFKIGKELCQGCILLPHWFYFYAEYIMRNARLEESQVEIKIARININNLRYADDTTLTAERSGELKRLLMKLKEESEKSGLKVNHQKTTIMASGTITSWQIDGRKSGSSDRFYLHGPQNHCVWWLQPWN